MKANKEKEKKKAVVSHIVANKEIRLSVDHVFLIKIHIR